MAADYWYMCCAIANKILSEKYAFLTVLGLFLYFVNHAFTIRPSNSQRAQ